MPATDSQESQPAAINAKTRDALESFAKAAPDWFQRCTFVRVNYDFFQNFFRRENLDKLEWPDIQQIGDHLHCFYRLALAKRKALGNPNHPIQHYRDSFTDLAHGPGAPAERVRRFTTDEKYKLDYFGSSAVSEIVGYLYPDEFIFRNGRDLDAAKYLELEIPKPAIKDIVGRMEAFHEGTRATARAYEQIVRRQTTLPLNLEVDQFFSWLCENVIEPTPPPPPPPELAHWSYAPGEGAKYWDECTARGIMSIGWDELGDLGEYESEEEILERLKEINPSETEPKMQAHVCWQFASEIRNGDIILVKKGKGILLGCGRVTGDYVYDETRPYHKHTRKVEWLKQGSWPLPGDMKQLGIKTLTRIAKAERAKNLLALMGEPTNPIIPPVKPPPPPIRYNMDDAMKDLFMPRTALKDILACLERKLCLILKGPPGVGKTFVAQRIAYLVMGERDDTRVKTVQFHPGYSYEDFVQGYRPDPDAPSGFALKNGVFHRFVTTARNDPDRDYVFIIDEINRGNLAKILGELLMLIEADKRSPKHALHLAYQDADEGAADFFIPENLYIIGAMNTADRSLAIVDHALRRRFSFATLVPELESNAFAEWLENHNTEPALIAKIQKNIRELNRVIAAEKGLGPGFEIGHSFFCQGTSMERDEAWYHAIVKGEIAPLLEEYFDDPEKVQNLTAALLR